MGAAGNGWHHYLYYIQTCCYSNSAKLKRRIVNEQISSAQSAEAGLPARHADPHEASLEQLDTPGLAAEHAGRPLEPSRPWWQTARATRAALVLILLLAAYFRFLGLTDWDSGTGQHPDERFFTDVTSLVRIPASFSEYFDAARSPGNPRNVGKTFFVYGSFPVALTRLVAVVLTPAAALPPLVTDSTTGGTMPNPELALPRLLPLQLLLNPEGYDLSSYGYVNKVGRVLVTLFDLGAIVLVFLIGSRLYDRRVGLLAALLSALVVMSIQQSHFYVDPIFSTFFTLLTLYWGVRAAQGEGAGAYVAMGISIGLAMSCRITLASLGLVAIVAAAQAALVWQRAARSDLAPDEGEADAAPGDSYFELLLMRGFPLLCLAGLITLLTFRIFNPYAFIGSTPTSPPVPGSEAIGFGFLQGWGFFDVRPDPRFLDNMQSVGRLVTGQDDFPPSQQWVGRSAYLFPFSNMVLWGMGPALGIIAWLGWAVAGWLLLRRLLRLIRGSDSARALAPLVLWVWVAFYFFWQGGQFASTMRYMLPIYGALIVAGSWLLVSLWDNAHAWPLPNGRAAIIGRWLPVASRWLPLLVIGCTFAWAYAFTRIYTRPHSRVMAAQWLVAHAPPGSRVTAEVWDDPLPLQATGSNLWGSVYRGIETAPYAEDDPQKYRGDGSNPGLLGQLEEADYITLTSNRVYGSATRLPMRYPILTRYYHYLFSGELGFKLVADITSYPTLLGIPIPDQAAEEAFTVYDHPKVLIFEKTPAFSRERAEQLLLSDANWDEVYKSPVSIADRNPTALRFTASEWARYRSGGTWAVRFNPQSLVNQGLLAPLVWLLALELLGLAAFALLFRLLPWLPDRGLSLARALGLLVVAYLAWLAGSLKLLPFAPFAVWLCALPLLAGGAWMAWRARDDLRAFWRQRRTMILSAQALYLGAFLLLLLVRWLNPDLWHPARGGEKPMEFAYLNAVLKSAAFAPYDPWFAGGYINYYYFGYVIVGTLIHLTTIVPTIAYNLAVPTIFALTALGAWGVVYNLLAPRLSTRARTRPAMPAPDHTADYTADHTPDPAAAEAEASPLAAAAPAIGRRWLRLERRALLSGWLAPFCMLLLGSLTQALWYIGGYASANQHRPEWAFWDSTRIVAGTINEFPFFTFLFADLHAHMIVMPFSLAVSGLLVALVRRFGAPTAHRHISVAWRVPSLLRLPVFCYLLLGLLGGTLRATNTWDYPTFMGLTFATFALLAWQHFRRERPRMPAEPVLLLAVRCALIAAGQSMLVLLISGLLFLPFTGHFATESSGVEFLREGLRAGWLEQVLYAQRTAVWDLLQIYGLWLFLLISAGVVLARWFIRAETLREHALMLFAIGLLSGAGGGWLLTRLETQQITIASLLLLVLLLAAAGWLGWHMRRLPPRKLLPLLWAATALALCAGVEVFVVRGDIGRMNTVFKFGLHAWMLFALVAAVVLPWLWREATAARTQALGWLWQGAAVLLLLASLVYPATATPSRIADRYAEGLPRSLDGALFMQYVQGSEQGRSFSLNEDYEAIQWMQQNIAGTPIILEAHLPSYRWAGRVAIYTGLPTLLGWEWHQVQQRNAVGAGQVIANRQRVIEEIYSSTDAERALRLLKLYGVEYLYVGGVERAIYNPAGLVKFEELAQQGQLERVYSRGATQIYRLVEPGTPTIFTTELPVVAPSLDTPPPLLLDQPVNELPVVGEYGWNKLASASSWAALLVWLLALYALVPLGLPLAVLVFGRWQDGGLVWARLIGLLLIGYAVWLPTSLGLWHYDMWGVAGGLLLVLAANGALLAWSGRAASEEEQPPLPDALLRGAALVVAHLKERRRALLMGEGLFLAGFLLFTGLRALNPDLWHPIWGGEKPMEFGFLNAILRSPVMPPYDPFFSGGYINYYYYGIYLVSLPIKITGLAPALAYNLVVPTIFALTLTGGYAIVAQITGRVRYGLAGAAFLTLLGNLAAVVVSGWSRGLGPVLAALNSGSLSELGAQLGDWYVGPSRVIPFTINEFPYWTFLFADLHPHMIALPVTLLAIALAYQYAQRNGYRPQRTVHRLARADSSAPAQQETSPLLLWGLLTALVLGTLAVTNSWDYPTYTLLVAAAIAGTAWYGYRGRGIPWLALMRAVLLVAALAIGGMALYMPFFDHFHAFVSGVGFVHSGTDIRGYLLIYGLFLAIVLPVVFGILWRLLRIEGPRLPLLAGRQRAGQRILPLFVCIVLPLLLLLVAAVQPVLGLSIWLSVLIVLGLVLFLERHLELATWFTLLLALLAWAVSLGVEMVFIRDHLAGGDFYRMNTMFKFGFQIWTLLSLAAAASLPMLLRGLGWLGRRLHLPPAVPQAVGLTVAGALALVALVFPLVGTQSRLANRFPVSLGPTLDGLAFLHEARFDYNCQAFPGCPAGAATLQIDLAPDADAIAWLNEHIEGTPVVAQSNLWYYRSYGVRVAANTGLPTIVSALHVDEQRDPSAGYARSSDVNTLFNTTDRETTLRLLAKYDVDYIYVGPIERAFYSAAGLQKFADMTDTYLEMVYDAPGAQIYHVNGIPPSYAEPKPFDFAAEDARIASTRPAPAAEEDESTAEQAEPPADSSIPPELRELEEQVAADPSNAPLAYGLAEKYRNIGRLDDAIRVLVVAAFANPQDVGLHHLWGDILTQAGRLDEAEQAYRNIAEAVPTAGNWNKLGTSLLQWGQYEKAEEALLKATELDAREPEPHFRLGQVYHQQGRQAEAVDALETYLQLAPDGYLAPDARSLLAELK